MHSNGFSPKDGRVGLKTTTVLPTVPINNSIKFLLKCLLIRRINAFNAKINYKRRKSYISL